MALRLVDERVERILPQPHHLRKIASLQGMAHLEVRRSEDVFVQLFLLRVSANDVLDRQIPALIEKRLHRQRLRIAYVEHERVRRHILQVFGKFASLLDSVDDERRPAGRLPIALELS